ncbi:MAG TPA: hypothetical protein DEO84_01055 [candidate division Zixibacteria bacterium]|nr:hypothetical protein [candidate division Zixibacteria bacterium]HBY99883.1 hypothetical protein [candidate division Zixibacteria bacterium]
MPTPSLPHHLARLIGPRSTWPFDMTADEEKIMSEHSEYIKKLVRQKKVLLAGPCFDPVFGLMILNVGNNEDAQQILDNDPSIKSGLMTYELQPMRASFIAEIPDPERYVENPSDRILRTETVVPASLSDVWKAWTTTDGIKSFFSDHATIELKLGGKFEVLFLMDRPYGEQGSEDCRILSYLPMSMLSFEWNTPPEFGPLRDIRTVVVLQFEELGPREVRVILTEHGWGTGPEWDAVYDYFNRAWPFVLKNLKESFS